MNHFSLQDTEWYQAITLTTFPNSRHLRSSRRDFIADFFNESGLDLVRQRLKKLSEEDLSQQL